MLAQHPKKHMKQNELLKNNYPKRKLLRLKNYDYGSPGFYYVTVCTQNRNNLFSNIDNESVQLTKIGHMIEAFIQKLPVKFPYIQLNIYTIMPNHLHLIIEIVGTNLRVGPISGQTHRSAPTLPSMIQWFKTMTTNAYINEVKKNSWPPFEERLWQRNYYERIIRSHEELQKTREYIQSNHLKHIEEKRYPRTN